MLVVEVTEYFIICLIAVFLIVCKVTEGDGVT